MKTQRGFVLVNALIIVAALAGAAVVLLARAETGRARLQAGQTSAQLAYYLDAFEELAISTLQRDSAYGAVDHFGEDWAKPDYNVAVDRGHVTGQVTELQGLYNLNWLANSNRTFAPEVLNRLLARQGLPTQIGTDVASFVQPGGPKSRSVYAGKSPPLDPVGGSLLLFDQLYDIPTLDGPKLSRLREIATVLPGDSTVNVNTALPDLIVGMIPQVNAGALNQLIQRRQTEPFSSIEAFVEEVELLLGDDEETEGAVDAGLFSVGSEWFRVDITAELDGLEANRTVVLHRLGTIGGIVTHYRITRFP